MLKVKCAACEKTAYPNEAMAIEARRVNQAVNHYRCDTNGTWHLTTKPKWGTVCAIRKTSKGWRVYNLGHHCWTFPTYEQALTFANKRARKYMRNKAVRLLAQREPVQLTLF
jgi:hypothetical protein